jgi:hypothetical protein
MIIEMATSEEDIASICRIRRQVFEYEMGLKLPALSLSDGVAVAHVLARLESTGEPVAALTVVDTTKEFDLRHRFGLDLQPQDRLARYTQLAVCKPYRGLNLPLMLILEAHYQFVAPGDFTHTWLLFDAERAAASSLCARLGFSASERVYHSHFGMSRILMREERSSLCQRALWQTQRYLMAESGNGWRSSHYDYNPLNNDQLTT